MLHHHYIGKTYGNKCIFKTEVCKNNPRLELAYIGECIIDQNQPQIEAVEVEENEEERCPAFCTQEWSPVCGSDGMIIINDFLKIKNLDFYH